MSSRLVAAVVVILATVLTGIDPAAADPAGPTDYESVFVDDEPAAGVTLEVLGGDSFIQLAVEEGTEVAVLGYENEPYIMIDAGGIVSVNRNSPATYLNEDRYQDVVVPDNVDADAFPDWEVVADDGVYAWHDHRTHWMIPDTLPPTVEGRSETQLVNEWELDMLVDGEDLTVHGELFILPEERTWVWAGLAVLAAGIAVALGFRSRVVAIGVVSSISGLLALVITFAERAAQPSELGPSPLALVLAVTGLVSGALTLFLAKRRLGMLTGFVAAAALAPWAVLVAGYLTKPVLPTTLDPAVAHTLAALAIGGIAGVVILAALVALSPAPSRSEVNA